MSVDFMNMFFFRFCLGVNSTEFEVGSSETSSSSHHNHTASKQLHESIPDDVDLTEVDQLVKPSKVHVQPLHADDLLYESTKFEPGAGKRENKNEITIKNNIKCWSASCQNGRNIFHKCYEANKNIICFFLSSEKEKL